MGTMKTYCNTKGRNKALKRKTTLLSKVKCRVLRRTKYSFLSSVHNFSQGMKGPCLRTYLAERDWL